MPREPGFKQKLCADMQGFSLHAFMRCDAEDRKGFEQLCRCITRPALANERVQCNAAGQVVLKLKTPWRDGTTHLVMSPLEFMQRLAALVPRLRRPAFKLSARGPHERLLCGDQPWATSVAEGSQPAVHHVAVQLTLSPLWPGFLGVEPFDGVHRRRTA